MSTIVVKTPSIIDKCCDHTDVIFESAVFLSTCREWMLICDMLESDDIILKKCSNCNNTIPKNWSCISSKSDIIVNKPSNEIIDFVKRIQNKSLLDVLCMHLKIKLIGR
jgi:hypothetical protein